MGYSKYMKHDGISSSSQNMIFIYRMSSIQQILSLKNNGFGNNSLLFHDKYTNSFED